MPKKNTGKSWARIGASFRENTLVRFAPTPASAMLYSYKNGGPPEKGELGSVVKVPVPGGRKTYLKGPGGGLVYVRWENRGVYGVAPMDLHRVSKDEADIRDIEPMKPRSNPSITSAITQFLSSFWPV